MGVEVGPVAPDAPDDAQRLAHAVAEGVHLGLAGGPLAGVVRGNERVVLDADDRHPVGGGPEMGIADLAHVPGGLGVRSLRARAPFGRVDPGVGEQLVEVGEAPDVADLGQQRGGNRGPDARDRLEPTGGLAVEQTRDVGVGILDLALQQVELIEQEADLEGNLGLDLGHRDRVGRGGLEALGLRLAQPPMTGARVGIGEGRGSSPGGSASRRGEAQHLPGGATGRVVEQLAQLREAQLDEAHEALADLRLLCHQGHREAGCLAQLGTGEWIAIGRRVPHGHLGEAPGIGRVGLRPGEPAPCKVLRRERVHHGDRDVPPAQVAGERHPVVAG